MQAPYKISEVVGVLNGIPSQIPEYIHVQMSDTKTESWYLEKGAAITDT